MPAIKLGCKRSWRYSRSARQLEWQRIADADGEGRQLADDAGGRIEERTLRLWNVRAGWDPRQTSIAPEHLPPPALHRNDRQLALRAARHPAAAVDHLRQLAH